MNKYLLALYLVSITLHAEELIHISPNEKPISIGDYTITYECKKNVNNRLLETLYSFAKIYSSKYKVNAPLNKFCTLTALYNRDYNNDIIILGVLIEFHEKKPSTDPNGVSEGVVVAFDMGKENQYGLSLFDSGYPIKTGICIDSNGSEISPSGCK